jgi:hypothetical protein
MPCPYHHPSNYTSRRVRVMKLLIMQYLQSPITSFLFCPNTCSILLKHPQSTSFWLSHLYAFLFSSIHATCHVHLAQLDLIILIIFVEEYKLWSPSLCSFLQPPTIVSLIDPLKGTSVPCSQIPSVYVFPLMSETKLHTHAKVRAKLCFWICQSSRL